MRGIKINSFIREIYRGNIRAPGNITLLISNTRNTRRQRKLYSPVAILYRGEPFQLRGEIRNRAT